VLTLQQKLRALPRRRSTWLLTAALTLSMKLLISTSRTAKRVAKPVELPMSQFLQIISSSQRQDLSALLITNSGKMLYKLADKACVTRPVAVSQSVMETLLRNGIEFGAAASESMTPAILLAQLFPLLWLALMIGLMRRQVGGGVGSAGRQADLTTLDRSLTFDDVAGIDEAKSEVRELVQILRNPQPYVAAGARLPSGVLLVGGPGENPYVLAYTIHAFLLHMRAITIELHAYVYTNTT
jgi:cell division protease FtsH